MLDTYIIELSLRQFLIMMLIMNIIGFCAMGFDKSFAAHETRSISEKTLLLIAFLPNMSFISSINLQHFLLDYNFSFIYCFLPN
ncbi:MAG: hypothetical protein PWP71_545 [Clostridia bacterium]|jgi:uncharacterized membrane protein YsdA (DUF1294 family)|nr:hypothetical protein [Clostridia bacterium]